MSVYKTKIEWYRAADETYTDRKYSRVHSWQFEGGITVAATASHHIVPLPYSNPDNVDPEQAFVASLSSCHMLTFLDIAAAHRFVVDSYIDDAEGFLEKDKTNRLVMTKVILKPRIIFSGDKRPKYEDLEKMHHKAHELCFIANSVKTEVITEIIM